MKELSILGVSRCAPGLCIPPPPPPHNHVKLPQAPGETAQAPQGNPGPKRHWDPALPFRPPSPLTWVLSSPKTQPPPLPPTAGTKLQWEPWGWGAGARCKEKIPSSRGQAQEQPGGHRQHSPSAPPTYLITQGLVRRVQKDQCLQGISAVVQAPLACRAVGQSGPLASQDHAGHRPLLLLCMTSGSTRPEGPFPRGHLGRADGQDEHRTGTNSLAATPETSSTRVHHAPQPG